MTRQEQQQYILNHYNSMTAQQIADSLGIARSMVYYTARKKPGLQKEHSGRFRKGHTPAGRKKWTPQEYAFLRKHYSDEHTHIIAEKLRRTVCAVYSRANQLALYKSPEWVKKHARWQPGSQVGAANQFQKGHVPDNKGNKMSAELRKKVAHTWFKKGNRPHNTRYDFTISLRHNKNRDNKYYLIRIQEGHWKFLHRYIWELLYGEIPKGVNIQFKDGNTLNCDIDNLYAVNRKYQVRENKAGGKALSPELKETVRLIYKLKDRTHEKQDNRPQ